MPRRQIALTAAALAWAFASLAAQGLTPAQDQPQLPAILEQFARTRTAAEFDENSGHLRALLRALDIPVESQVFVFSATSLQTDRIAPRVPRAIYFNDHAYVGYVADSPIIEIVLADPDRGFGFYQIDQKAEAPNPQTDYVCQLCHDPGRTGVSRLIMRSHYTDSQGNALQRRGQMDQLLFETNDRTPFERRWGGWYVTGTYGSLRHMGNLRAGTHTSHISDPVAYVKTLDLATGANLTSVALQIDPRPYLTLDSDVVSLMALGHQVTVENEMVAVRRALRGRDGPGDLDALVEPLVRALMFAAAQPLPGPVQGTTQFRRVFEAAGVRDPRGRSLRAFDLERRVFRYPVSHMIYSDSFNTLPAPIKEAVYRRMAAALTASASAGVDDERRVAAIEILRATKPDMAAFLAGR